MKKTLSFLMNYFKSNFKGIGKLKFYHIMLLLLFFGCTPSLDKSIFEEMSAEEIKAIEDEFTKDYSFSSLYSTIEKIRDESFKTEVSKVDYLELRFSDFINFNDYYRNNQLWLPLFELTKKQWREKFERQITEFDSITNKYRDYYFLPNEVKVYNSKEWDIADKFIGIWYSYEKLVNDVDKLKELTDEEYLSLRISFEMETDNLIKKNDSSYVGLTRYWEHIKDSVLNTSKNLKHRSVLGYLEKEFSHKKNYNNSRYNRLYSSYPFRDSFYYDSLKDSIFVF